jgi:hypothetical protein
VNGVATLTGATASETQVVGSLLLQPERIAGAAKILQPRDFADPYHRATFDVLVAMHRGGNPVDVVTVKQRIDSLELFNHVSAHGYLAETGASVANARSCDYHIGIVAEASRKRRLGQVGQYIIEAAANGHSSGDILADLWSDVDDLRREVDSNAGQLESWPLDEFLRLDHRQNFLINGVVTEAQPGCVSAKSKSNKTTMALAMAMAASTGRPFLGHYEVPEPVPSGIISAESGGATLAESFERVAASMGLFANEVRNLHVSTKMPLLTTPEGRDQLERHILKYGLKTQFVDPTYKAFAGVDDTQLSQMALHLFPLSEIIDRTGCSIVMVHHNRKSPARQGDHYAEPTQDDIQGTGLLRDGLYEFEQSVGHVVTRATCGCASEELKLKKKQYDFGSESCLKAGSCGIIEFLIANQDVLQAVLDKLEATPSERLTGELSNAVAFIRAFLDDPNGIRGRDPCKTVGDLLIALESAGIPTFYTMNGKESQHLCRVVNQSMVVCPANPMKDDVQCDAGNADWPAF